MENKKRARWRRILSLAYQKPLSKRWRRDDVPDSPGWIFDALVITTCVLLAFGYFFGIAGVVGAIFISFTLFAVMENAKRKAARKAADVSTPEASNQPAPATMAEPAAQDAKRKPMRSFRLDDVSVSIWVREQIARGQPMLFWSTTFERSYKDRNGAWCYTKSFDRDSLGKIVTLCQQASEFIDQQQEAA